MHHYEFTNVNYDRSQLYSWYQQHAHLEVFFSDWMNARLPAGGPEFRGAGYGTGFKTLDYDTHYGRPMRDDPYIAALLQGWSFYPELADTDVDVLIYPARYKLKAHTDKYMGCGIMYPILPAESPAAINFYRPPPGQQLVKGQEYNVVQSRDLIYSYRYSTEHPAMFDGQIIHDVRNGAEVRVFLRVKLCRYQFQEIISLQEKNLLYKTESK
jgi:hypothetical protein